MNSENFNIILSNEFIDEDGDEVEKDSKEGLLKFRFPKGITFPAHACVEIQNLCSTEDFSQQPRILSIDEFTTQSYIGNDRMGKVIHGFIGTVNDDITDKQQFGKVYLNNNQPFQVQELTLRIQDATGRKASLNSKDKSDYYDLDDVNTWERNNDNTQFTAVRLNETHWKLVGTNNTYYLEFETPTTGVIGGNLSNTFVLDPTPQTPQTDPSLTLTFNTVVRTFTPNAGAGITEEIPKQGAVNNFALNLAVSSKKNTY